MTAMQELRTCHRSRTCTGLARGRGTERMSVDLASMLSDAVLSAVLQAGVCTGMQSWQLPLLQSICRYSARSLLLMFCFNALKVILLLACSNQQLGGVM